MSHINNFDPLAYGETPETLSHWLNIIRKERAPLYHKISHLILPHTVAIEIGAGSGWLSVMLSQNHNITHITAIDNDKRRIQLAQKFFLHRLNANHSKISFCEADFHNLSNIQDQTIDIIFVDAALHHTNHLEILLQEMSRVLKDGGKIIAIREPILPSFFPLTILRKKSFGWRQKMNGDIENTYTRNEWSSHFTNSGFNLSLQPLFDGSLKDHILEKKPFSQLNGWLYNRYYFIATKNPSYQKTC